MFRRGRWLRYLSRRHPRGRRGRAAANFWFSQIAPIEGLILAVIFPKGQGSHCLCHFIAEIEGMAGIDIVTAVGCQQIKQGKRIAGSQVKPPSHQVNLPPLGEDSKVWVANGGC